MTRKTTLTALITAATILANANAAQALGWNMSWSKSGYSAGGVVLNGTSLNRANTDAAAKAPLNSFRVSTVRRPSPAGPISTPYPNVGTSSK